MKTKKFDTYLNLLKELTIADFKLRYNGSIIGVLWFIIKPLAMLAVLYVIFGLVLKVGIDNYVLFLFIGIILWNFFVESTTMSMANILDKRSIIRAIYLPRHILVMSSSLNAFMSLAINIVLLIIMLLIYGINLTGIALITLAVLALLFIFSLGVAYLLAAFYVKYRDVGHIWDVILQLGFWITPVIYNITLIPQKYIAAYMLNPLAWAIHAVRELLIYNTLAFSGIFPIIGITFGVFIIGYVAYSIRSKYFAEEL